MSNVLMIFEKPVQYYAEQILLSVLNGEQNPLDIHVNIAKLDKILKMVNSNEEFQEATFREFEKYGEKTISHKGATLQQQEVGVKYDYSGCNDPLMNEYMRQKEELDAKIKERSKFLQSIPVSGIVDPDTGSFIYPASRSSKTIIKTTIK